MKHSTDILLRPRVTEKSSMSAELQNAYVFEVAQDATKTGIINAVKKLYKVVPAKVNVVRLPSKKVFLKGKAGKTNRVKKAYIYLKKGDKIELGA